MAHHGAGFDQPCECFEGADREGFVAATVPRRYSLSRGNCGPRAVTLRDGV
jgi:hypothetical protein